MDVICGWNVANSILRKSFEEENYITPLKLNCMVYLIYSDYLYLHGEELFSEPFHKTESGPVVPSIDFKFGSFENRVITKYAKDASGKVMGVKSVWFEECLAHIWEKCKNESEEDILSYIESGYGFSKTENGEILSEREILQDEISRKEKILEGAKCYIKRFNT